ncbi:hypothetical protein EV356DRAFT_474359 [Viridothelium virens]|uniref:Amino acid transporter transmembrane domain-containing protein n=1 Tax=Viridothelium virens TaxID=1048519 RepID=A0A6A6GXF3_VIRVR|nr:hypothetical protein EV356DRAFT_474359 [Viridothelium virens]
MASYSAISSDEDRLNIRPPSLTRTSSQGSRNFRPRRRKDVGVAGQASWISSVVNLLNTIVGAGVLAMPAALSHMGILLGIIVIIWAGITAGFGLYLQTRCARYLDRGSASFFALSQITYPNAAVVFDAAIAIKCFGVGVSYLIIIGDLMPGVVRGFSEDIGGSTFLVDRHFWVSAFMLIVIPFSFLRRLDSLKYTSVIALISIGYLIVLVVYHFGIGDTIRERGRVRGIEPASAAAVLASFPVIVFAYTCHQNMFSILNEIANNSRARTTAVVTASIGIACFIYILVGLTGYLSFGDKVSSNIVSDYTPSVASTIGRAAIVVLVMFSYPLQVHPCRASVDAVLKWRPGSFNKPKPPPSPSPPRDTPLLASPATVPGAKRGNSEMSETRFAAITTGVIVLSYIVAMTVSSLAKVLAYVGSTGSTSISFILPGLFYYKISSPDSVHHQKLLKEDDDEDELSDVGEDDEGEGFLGKIKVSRWKRGLLRKAALALAIYGLVVMVVCLFTNVFIGAVH